MGNGYIATTINVGTTYIGGVFNGHGSTTPSHRARLPATTNIAITNGKPAGAALDIQVQGATKLHWAAQLQATPHH